jgi:hypothetical protein
VNAGGKQRIGEHAFWFHAGFSLGSFIYPEDVGDMFLQNIH